MSEKQLIISRASRMANKINEGFVKMSSHKQDQTEPNLTRLTLKGLKNRHNVPASHCCCMGYCSFPASNNEQSLLLGCCVPQSPRSKVRVSTGLSCLLEIARSHLSEVSSYIRPAPSSTSAVLGWVSGCPFFNCPPPNPHEYPGPTPESLSRILTLFWHYHPTLSWCPKVTVQISWAWYG